MNQKNEIEKVYRRVTRWMTHPEQTNARIMKLFMELSQNGKNGVFIDMLEDEFDIRFPQIRDRFKQHFSQMKNEAERNHCKVFEEDEEKTVMLWFPVRGYIIDLYS